MALDVREITDRAAWDALVNEHGGHPLQLWGWGDLKSAHGWSAERVEVRDGDRFVAAAQLLSRRLPGPLGVFVYVPRGPVLARAEDGAVHAEVQTSLVADALADYVHGSRRAVALSIEPDETEFELSSRWRRAPQETVVLPSRTIVFDLHRAEDELMAVMRKNHRRNIRKAMRNEELEIRQVTTRDQLAEVMEVYHSTSARADFGLHEESYYFDAFEMLGDRAQVFAVYHEDKPVSFLFMGVTDRTAFELYGGMNQIGGKLNANYWLKWHLITHYKQAGCTRYDVGGLFNEGVSSFKTGFADHETNFVGTWDVPGRGYTLWTRGVPLAKKLLRGLRSLRSKRAQ